MGVKDLGRLIIKKMLQLKRKEVRNFLVYLTINKIINKGVILNVFRRFDKNIRTNKS